VGSMNLLCWIWFIPLFLLPIYLLLESIRWRRYPRPPDGVGRDDRIELRRLIGMNSEAVVALHNCGVDTIGDVAKAKRARLRAIIEHAGAGVSRELVDSWPYQADLLLRNRIDEWEAFRRDREEAKASVAGLQEDGFKSHVPRHRWRRRFGRGAFLVAFILSLLTILLYLLRLYMGCQECVAQPQPPCQDPVSQECPANCQTAMEPDRILIYTDMFDFDKSETFKETAGIVVAMMKEAREGFDPSTVEITEIIGHTDPIGKPPHNEQLGLKRAKAIEFVLREKLTSDQMKNTKVSSVADSKPLTDVLSICRSLYPDAERSTSPNFKNIVRCFRPLRRVEIRVKPLVQGGKVGLSQRKNDLPASGQYSTGEKRQ